MVKLDKETSLFLKLISKDFNNDNIANIDFKSIDFNKVYQLVYSHALIVLSYDRTRFFCKYIDKRILDRWLYDTGRKITQQENIADIQRKVIEIFEKNNIDYAIIKGFSSAYYYSNSHTREIGDVDILIDKNDSEKADELLIDNGLMFLSNSNIFHYEYDFNGVTVEVHWNVSDFPENECGKKASQLFGDFMKHRITYNTDTMSFYGLDPVLHAVNLIIHISRHIQRGGIGMRHIIDFAEFCDSEAFRQNKDEIIEKLREIGLYQLACYSANVADDYLNYPIKQYFEKCNESVLDEFFVDVIESGNFGRNNKEKYYGSAALTNDKNVFISVYTFSINCLPITKKVKILIPFAPIIVFVRYLFRAATGKRTKVDLKNYFRGSVGRAKLYEKLNMFNQFN